MNKKELIAAAAAKAGTTQKDAEAVINAALETLTAALQSGDRVQVSGFGIFEVKTREARVGRNPRTKEAVQIPASKTPVFKPSKALKEIVEG